VIPNAGGAVNVTPKRMYTVQKDETFWKIGQRFGVSADAIQKANPNLDPNNLQAGNQIVIPNAEGTVNVTPKRMYTVQKDETFWKIGQRFGVSADAIQKANPNLDPNNLQAGNQIVIPNAENPKLHNHPNLASVIKGHVEITDIEKYMLAKLTEAEAEGEPIEGKIAVAAVVLNRLKSPKWPKTIKSVIEQSCNLNL
jgi:LysM repeat protein